MLLTEVVYFLGVLLRGFGRGQFMQRISGGNGQGGFDLFSGPPGGEKKTKNGEKHTCKVSPQVL